MIAITAALKAEIAPLTQCLQQAQVFTKLGRKFHLGKIGSTEVLTAVVGHGKIDTAGSTQLLISEFSPKKLIHIGSAGGLSPEVKIGDFVLGHTIIEHDYHSKFNRITPPPEYYTSKELNQELSVFDTAKRLTSGIIISGNEDIVEVQRRNELFTRFKGHSVDWESAASTRICLINNIKTSVIRAVVDGAHEQTHTEFASNLNQISTELCNWVYSFINGKSS